jgi:hypothetical protein
MSHPIVSVILGILIAIALGGSIGAVLLSKLRKISPVELSKNCADAKANVLQAEANVDVKMSELQEVHEQSLRGMKLDVMAELAKPMVRKQETPLDAKVRELKKLTEEK